MKEISKSELEILVRARLRTLGSGQTPPFRIERHTTDESGACNWYLIAGPLDDWDTRELSPLELLDQLRIVDGEFRGRFNLTLPRSARSE